MGIGGKSLNILFVCTGNTCRSSMAEALLKNMLATEGLSHFSVRSAGIAADPGAQASPYAVEALAELGLDLSSHRAQNIDAPLAEWAHLILTMTGHHQRVISDSLPQTAGKVHLLKEFAAHEQGDENAAALDIADPFGQALDAYRASRDELVQALELLLQKIKNATDADS